MTKVASGIAALCRGVLPTVYLSARRQPLEADQREMSERRHGAALEQAHAAMTLGPSRQPLPAEFRPPAQPPCDRRKALLEHAPRPSVGAEMVDQDDLAARLGHAGKFVERCLGVRH